jgi:polyribonucleotide nucleotidyltransferase
MINQIQDDTGAQISIEDDGTIYIGATNGESAEAARTIINGIAMGLVSDEVDGQTQYAALTDILGAEDAFGDMDFKVAGTREFVTAIQLDTKLDGIPASVLAGALTQARDARLHILDVMNEAIDAPDEMSPFAPRVISVQVPVDKIGEVIGPKGKMINQIQDETGAQISIEDDGTVYIGATDGPSADAARAMVNAIANPQMPEVGERFLGTVVKTTTFGAFVSLLPGKDGLLHISEVRKLVGGKRIDAVEDVLAVGQKVQVELKEIDPRGKLSLAAVLPEGEGDSPEASGSQPSGGDHAEGDERHEGGQHREGGRHRNRRRGRGDRTEQGTGTAEADQLVEAHESGAPASSEDAAS